jgi:hypothetical protein
MPDHRERPASKDDRVGTAIVGIAEFAVGLLEMLSAFG